MKKQSERECSGMKKPVLWDKQLKTFENSVFYSPVEFEIDYKWTNEIGKLKIQMNRNDLHDS